MRGPRIGALLLLVLAAVLGARTLPGPAPLPGRSLPDPAGAPATLVAGPSSAPHRVVVFTDYECAACAALERALGPELRAGAREGTLRFEVRHFPLGAHRRARRAAAWAACAAQAGRGWAMHEALMGSTAWRGPGPSDPALRALAASVGLDPERVAACVEGPGMAGRLAADRALGGAVGIAAVPAVFVNGRALPRPSPRALRRILRRDGARGRRARPTGRPVRPDPAPQRETAGSRSVRVPASASRRALAPTGRVQL